MVNVIYFINKKDSNYKNIRLSNIIVTSTPLKMDFPLKTQPDKSIFVLLKAWFHLGTYAICPYIHTQIVNMFSSMVSLNFFSFLLSPINK